MNRDHRVIILLVLNALVFFMLNQLNAALAPLAVHLSLDSLFLLFSALYLRLSQGILIGLITALMIDAALPVPFGMTFLLFCVAYAMMLRMRMRMRRENRLHLTVVALWTNLIILLGKSFILAGSGIVAGAYWIRVLTDVALSEIAIALLAAWFIEFQRRLLVVFDIDIASELQSL